MNLELLKNIRLLYVEDDEAIRKVLSRGLKRRVKELEVAINGEDGLEKFKGFKPDIIVTDIKMPKMTGLQMTRKIRELNQEIPIIITSAHGESETLLEAIESGVSGYILKPIDKDKLMQTIINFAKIKILEDELKNKNKQLMIASKNTAIGELIENMAHQWRQPLSVISMLAGSIQLKNDLNLLEKEFIDESTNKIIETTTKLSDTIEYLRNTYITQNSQKEEFFIQSTIDSTLSNYEQDIEKYGIQIIKNIDSSLVIKNYKNMFRQSISYIIENAIDILKSDDGNTKLIFIEVLEEDDYIIVTIKDSGGGVCEKDLEHIFEPYFTTHHKSEGKGLGLHMVLQMVQSGMGGIIEAINEEFTYDENLYKGAKFIIKLK